MSHNINYAKSIFFILLILGFMGLIAVLKVSATFTLPLVVAALLSFVFYPFCKKLNSFHIPWGLCICLVLLLALVVLFVVGNLLATSLATIVGAYSKYESRFTSLYKLFCNTFKIEFDEDSSLFVNLWNSLNVRTLVQNLAISLSSQVMSIAKITLVIALFIIFFLLELKTVKTKVNVAFPEQNVRSKIFAISSNIIKEVTHYISIKFLVSLMTGFLVFLLTVVINMDFPVIWGFIAFVLNFIPNFGSIFSWGITTLFALLQFWPQWGYVIYVGVAVLAVNMILGNFVEPRWEGSDLGLSPFIILVSLSFWGWLWGFVGMILSVPLTVIIKIICENVTLLHPIAILLGNTSSVRYQKTQGE